MQEDPNRSRRIRVLNVLFEARYGGPQKRASEVGEALLTYGVETVLCRPLQKDAELKGRQEPSLPVRHVAFEHIPRPRDLRRVLRWMALLPRDVQRFVSLFLQEKPDVVHVNGAFFLPPAIAAKLAKIPLVWHLNDTILPKRVAPLFGAFAQILADQVVVAAEAVASHYGVSRGAYETIYAPVNVEHFPSSRSLVGQRREHEVPRVGLIANWSPIKGVEYFVQALAIVRGRLASEVEVVLAGAKLSSHADYCQKVNDLIKKLDLGPAIRDYGFVSSVSRVLSNIDVLVMSSTTEASPMIVLEGMAAGVPVVAADVGGVRELLLGDSARPAGIVVPPRDSEAFAAAILDLLKHPEKATSMGENGRWLVRERFSLKICTRKHFDLYTNVVDRKCS